MTRLSLAVLAAAVLAWCLCVAGCAKAPEPAPTPTTERTAVVESQPASPTDDEAAVMTPLDGSALPSGESGPGGEDLLAGAMDEPLVTDTGEEITLFGPLGPAFLKLIGAGDAVIEGDNTAGVISGKPGGEEMEISYSAAEHTAETMGFEEPKSLERSSGFEISGLVPESVVRGYLESMARAGGESQPNVEVTEEDRRVAVDAAVYTTDGKATEVAAKLVGGDASKYASVPLGESAVVCMPTDPAKTALFIVAAVPESEEVQVTYLNLREAPRSLQGQLTMMRAMAAAQAQQGGATGPGGTKTMRMRPARKPE